MPKTNQQKNLENLIENSVGSTLFQHLFVANDDGSATDVMQGGELSCAFFVSSLLAQVDLLDRPHATVAKVEKLLHERGWQETDSPKMGDIVLWPTGKAGHEHIGFYIDEATVLSNSTTEKVPVKHGITMPDGRSPRAFLARNRSARPVFITGNAHKAQQMEKMLGVPFDHQKLDLDEIQSKDPAEVIEHKVRQAYGIIKRPVFVDDFSFWFDDLDGLPGPFIKFFAGDDVALEKLCRLADGLPSRRVTARAYFGYFDGEELKVIHGELRGEIVDHPRGDLGICTDRVFAVDGYGGRTRSELSRDEFDVVYAEVRALDEVKRFLQSKQ